MLELATHPILQCRLPKGGTRRGTGRLVVQALDEGAEMRMGRQEFPHDQGETETHEGAGQHGQLPVHVTSNWACSRVTVMARNFVPMKRGSFRGRMIRRIQSRQPP